MDIENKVGIIILARYNSSRLPGKALKTIAGKPVMQYIVERINTIVPINNIILATSENESDNPLAEFAAKNGLACYRGSLEKVAQRFYEAAKQLNCQFACRINGDNIFLDPEILSIMLEQAKSSKYSFLSNVKGRTFPKGMSIEIVEMSYYKKHLATILNNAYYTEHVLVYLYELAVSDLHYYLQNKTLPEAAGLQLALDTNEDFERSQWILRHLEIPHTKAGMAQVLALSLEFEKLSQTKNT